jgi:hypothetical protein
MLIISLTIIKALKFWRMRRAQHEAHITEMRNALRVLIRKPEAKRPLRSISIGRRIILNWHLKQ